MVSTCMLRRILKKADAITRKPIAISRNQTQSDAIRRADAITRKPIAVDASRVEASTSAWRSDVPPSATCGEKESEGRRREHSHAPPSGPAKRLLDL